MKDGEYAIGQACLMLGVDRKTLNRWLEQLGEEKETDRYDGRVRKVTAKQLAKIAEAHERTLRKPLTLADALSLIADLQEGRAADQARIVVLEAEIAAIKETRKAAYVPVTRDNGQETSERRRAYHPRQHTGIAGLPQRMGIGKNYAGKELAVPHGANSWASAAANWPWREDDLATDEAALRFIRWYLADHPQAGRWQECNTPACPCHTLDTPAATET